MRELEPTSDHFEKTEIHAQQQKEYEKKLIGEIKPHPGQILWEINRNTKAIRPAEYITIDVDYADAMKGDFSPQKELVIIDDCVYIPALNKTTALKKLEKNPDQSFYYKKQPVADITELTKPSTNMFRKNRF